MGVFCADSVAEFPPVVAIRTSRSRPRTVESRAMNLRAALLIAASSLLVVLGGCGPRSEDAEPPHPDWIIKSQVAFYEADFKTPRPALKEPMRLWVPYVGGDIYGSPNEGELAPVVLNSDLTFTLNLNTRYLRLGPALVPTSLSQNYQRSPISINRRNLRFPRFDDKNRCIVILGQAIGNC